MRTSPDQEVYADNLASVLELDEIGDDRFSGRVAASDVESAAARRTLYGGQVAAQSLMAAGRTLAQGWRPHSLHGYFLRPGRTDRRVELHVDRDRDGRSFSARHVSAIQDGQVIFSMLASFCVRDMPSLLDEVRTRPDPIPGPDGCEPYGVDRLVDARQVTPLRFHEGRRLHPDALWARTPQQLAGDPLTQCAALTYLSDLGSGFGQMERAEVGIGGISLDHALWFHESVPSHEWILLDMWPISAVAGRGVYHGSLRDRTGRLGATIVQENLLQ